MENDDSFKRRRLVLTPKKDRCRSETTLESSGQTRKLLHYLLVGNSQFRKKNDEKVL